MDYVKIGDLIAKLRKERKLTQKNIADALNISNKTVSKWECGLGAPDISLWSDLSTILGVEIQQLMEGEIALNPSNPGKMSRTQFFVCLNCQNVLTATGSAYNFCCGRKLEALAVNEDNNRPTIYINESDADLAITIEHPMSRSHYILFTAFVKDHRIILDRLYPEQEAHVRLPYMRSGTFYIYCTQHGLTAYKLKS